MFKIAYVFDEDVAIRELLWKAFKPRGYLIRCYPRFGACPDTFRSELDCKSSHACGEFILASIDFPSISRFDFIEDQIIKKGCHVRNIGLMSRTWSNTDLIQAQDLGCKAFQKPFSIEEINSWIDDCARKVLLRSSGKMSECVTL